MTSGWKALNCCRSANFVEKAACNTCKSFLKCPATCVCQVSSSIRTSPKVEKSAIMLENTKKEIEKLKVQYFFITNECSSAAQSLDHNR